MNSIEADIQEVKAILDAELQKPESLSQAGIVRRYMPIIMEYLEQGLTWEVMLGALNSKGITLNLRTFQQTVYRLKKNKTIKIEPPTSATPVARSVGGGDKHELAQPVTATSIAVTPSINLTAPIHTVPSLPGEPIVTSGWELEDQDNLIPAELLKLAFVEIAGQKYDVRDPIPFNFGDPREAVHDKVNPSSPNWYEYVERDKWRSTFDKARRIWRLQFKRWLIEQGFSAKDS